MKKIALTIFCLLLLSMMLICTLYIYSKGTDNVENGFNRVFPANAISYSKALDIQYESYYIAGVSSNHIYLGLLSLPLNILITNTFLTDTQHVRLRLEGLNKKITFKALRVNIDSPYFYLTDKTVPIIMSGTVENWSARRYMYDSAYFAEYIPINRTSFAGREVNSSMESVIAKQTNTFPHKIMAPDLLQKQIDGFFCVDGMLHYNDDLACLVYVYYYRNQFICADTSLNLLYRGNTIDTISKAQIKVSQIASENSLTMGAPPFRVNKKSCTAGNWLFVNSNLMAENEDKETFNESSVIDVYDLSNNGAYKFSFYIPSYKGGEMQSFRVSDDILVAMHDHYLLTYKLNHIYFENKSNFISNTEQVTP